MSNTPDTSSMEYKYGIFARIKDSGSRGWTDDGIKYWMTLNGVKYEDTDNREDLVQRIKAAGYK